MTLTFPTIHLNGTSKKELLQAQLDAMAAVDAAIAMLGAAAPNGRDYYPQGDAAISKALHEHIQRVKLLENVYRELEQVAEHINADPVASSKYVASPFSYDRN